MGLGGDPVHGEWTVSKPAPPKGPTATASDNVDIGNLGGDEELMDHLKKIDTDPDDLVQRADIYDYHWLKAGLWTQPLPFAAFRSPNLHFLTVYAELCATNSFARAVKPNRAVFEFEVLVDGKTVKTFTEASPHGAVVSIFLPLKPLVDGKMSPAALEQIRGLSAYSKWKGDYMESLPWGRDPLPEHQEMVTDCSGFGLNFGYKIRTSSELVFLDEFRVLRQMGVNGLRGRPAFFESWEQAGRDEVKPFLKVRIGGCGGYGYAGVPRDSQTGKISSPPPWAPGVGCPSHPVYSNRVEEGRRAVAELVEEGRLAPVKSAWLLTDDEIGHCYGGTAEGREHIGVCTNCIASFRGYLKGKGLKPSDFGAADWEPVRPVSGYFSETYEVRYNKAQEAAKKAAPKLDETVIDFGGNQVAAKPAAAAPAAEGPAAPMAEPAKGLAVDATVVDKGDEKDPEPELNLEAVLGFESGLADEVPGKGKGQPKEKPAIPPPGLSKSGWLKLSYWTMRYINDFSAGLFTPRRDAFRAANEAKRQALEAGKTESPEALQPWFFMYALRGNTFLMGGSSLDFFDFYRYSDTGFMYETSNRDPRVWPWDSYLCDVGRTLHEKLGLAFGIYVKPHRGAAVQRALSSAARGARCIYWYTYGPEWWKGDTFGGNTGVLANVSLAARLIAAAEPAAWEGRWKEPAPVAVVRPRTSELMGNSAQWEDGKWVYAALQHAHIPVDALDEELLLSEDLSRYRAIYVTGSHVRREVAVRLAAYVKAGGSLMTGCGGLAQTEACEPLDDVLLPVFGLKSRSPQALWGGVHRYGATGLPGISALTNAPAAAQVTAGGAAPFALKVGWERLDPLPETTVVATFADGGAALTKHTYGKGTAWLAGFYTGMEYATGVMKPGYNTAVDFSGQKRGLIAAAALEAGARPTVDASEPLIEGVWVTNDKTKKQAVMLMNWSYNGRASVTFSNVTVRLAGGAGLAKVHSFVQRQDVATEIQGPDLLVKLGVMREGDVLTLE